MNRSDAKHVRKLRWKSWLTVVAIGVALAMLSSCGSESGGPTDPGARELDSGDLGPGATYTHRFTAAGTFGYHCIHHGPMTGQVDVSTAATDTLVHVGIVSSTTPFPAATVKPGGRVVWTNNDGMVHTVTSN